MTEQEKAELQEFIQSSFTKEQIEAIGLFAAMVLDINFMGLTISEIFEKVTQKISDMDNDKVNQGLAEILTDKKKQKELADKIKKRLVKWAKELHQTSIIKAEIRRAKTYISPNTKASNQLFGCDNEDFYDSSIELKTEGKISKKKITVALGINYRNDVDIGIKLSGPYKGQILTAFDRIVHDAIVTLYVDGGNENITTNMIYQVISGNTENHLSRSLNDAINESIDRMFHSWVVIDAKKQAEIYGWDDGYYKGHVLNCSIVGAYLNGQLTICAHVCEPPVLYRYAHDCGQIIRYDVKMLNVPSLENSVECITLKTYLLQQIQIMSHNKDFNHTIMFDTLYELLNIQAPTKDALLHKKKQIRGHVIKCLDYWTAEKLIQGYEVKKTGKTLDRVTLKVKLVKKKFITD